MESRDSGELAMTGPFNILCNSSALSSTFSPFFAVVNEMSHKLSNETRSTLLQDEGPID